MDRMNIREGTNAFEDVGGMTEHVFDILWGGPGNAGESTEGSGIAEIPAGSEQADVQRMRCAGDDRLGGFEGLR